MGTNTLQTAVDGVVISSDNHNSIKGALTQDFLPRNSSGVVTDEAGDLGSSSYSWKDLYVKSLNILPTGMMVPYAGSTAPSKWLLTDGDTIGDIGSGADHESAEHETLFELLKTSWGNGGSEVWANGDTVLLPDTRGRFVRSWDAGAGRDSGRSIGSTQTGANLSHNHTTNSHTHTYTVDQANTTGGSLTNITAGNGASVISNAQLSGGSNSSTTVIVNNNGTESRPINLSCNYIIKV